MIERLPIAIAQVQAGTISKLRKMKSKKPYIICIKQKKLLKMYITI